MHDNACVLRNKCNLKRIHFLINCLSLLCYEFLCKKGRRERGDKPNCVCECRLGEKYIYTVSSTSYIYLYIVEVYTRREKRDRNWVCLLLWAYCSKRVYIYSLTVVFANVYWPHFITAPLTVSNIQVFTLNNRHTRTLRVITFFSVNLAGSYVSYLVLIYRTVNLIYKRFGPNLISVVPILMDEPWFSIELDYTDLTMATFW